MVQSLLIATHNAGKLAEIQPLLSPVCSSLQTLTDLGITAVADETTDTFYGNASQKARFYAREAGCWTLADDSGLAVDALGGAPGVDSAIYGGTALSDAERCELLLKNLTDVADALRTAHFVTVAVLCAPDGEVVRQAEGKLKGTITHAPRGANGFGYDPVFRPDDSDKTLAMLSRAAKSKISHRGKAFRAMAEQIKSLKVDS